MNAQRPPLSDQQRQWIEAAWQQVDAGRLVQLLVDMVNIPSPTGEEGPLARFLVSYMSDAGLNAFYQPLDARRGNAVGRLRGNGEGADLLLYGHIDFAFTGGDADYPGLGFERRRDMPLQAFLEDGNVVGIGAENPKGHVACLIGAAEAVAGAKVPLRGDLLVGLAAGGMPVLRPSGESDLPGNLAHGVGCEHLLRYGVRPDFAVLGKTGWVVCWEEPGLCWFKVVVRGLVGYAGTRHIIPYKNPIVDAAVLIPLLEEWLQDYASRHVVGTVAPQGAIGAIEAGWPDKTTFIPAACTLYVDLRINPDTDPVEAKREFGEAIRGICARHPELEVDWDMILAIPGFGNDYNNWIVQSCIRAWEHMEGRPHTPRLNFSGVTDWNILRAWGIPAARLGMDPGQLSGMTDGWSLGVANIQQMERLVKAYIYVIVDTCTRTREEIKLSTAAVSS